MGHAWHKKFGMGLVLSVGFLAACGQGHQRSVVGLSIADLAPAGPAGRSERISGLQSGTIDWDDCLDDLKHQIEHHTSKNKDGSCWFLTKPPAFGSLVLARIGLGATGARHRRVALSRHKLAAFERWAGFLGGDRARVTWYRSETWQAHSYVAFTGSVVVDASWARSRHQGSLLARVLQRLFHLGADRGLCFRTGQALYFMTGPAGKLRLLLLVEPHSVTFASKQCFSRLKADKVLMHLVRAFGPNQAFGLVAIPRQVQP